MAALVLHINREMLHHGAEIALLRDLYLWGYGADERRLLVPGGAQKRVSVRYRPPGLRVRAVHLAAGWGSPWQSMVATY